jgi:16S rRNA processing protein RimM
MSKYISIGKVLNFHGIKGEIKVGFTKGKNLLIESLKEVFIEEDGIVTKYNISTVRFHKQFALIKLEEINSINDVEEIKGKELLIEKEIAEKLLTEDEFFISDLIDLNVFNKDDEQIGKVKDVGTNGASEILEITDSNNKIHLIPFVRDLVPIVNLREKFIVINDIEGLIE